MNAPILSGDALRRALAIRDLTDPSQGPHAIQLIVDDIVNALVTQWSCALTIHRAPRVVSADDNYDALAYPKSAAARDARYSRWISARALLRTQTSALIPGLLRARAPDGWHDDELIACPGIVYRRDCIDRLHVGEPHQLDLWRLAHGRPGIEDMIQLVVRAALPGRAWRTIEAEHPYTRNGLQIDVDVDGRWIEIGECGIASPDVLAAAGIDTSRVRGLAMGLGLDRLVMLRKGVDDIRLLRATDRRISRQMLDLAPYKEVSRMPAMTRDMSIVVHNERTDEDLGDTVRSALGHDAALIEDLRIVSSTPYDALPDAARQRLQITPHQRNVLLRVVLRPLDRTLTDAEGNAIRNRIYTAVHEGNAIEWST